MPTLSQATIVGHLYREPKAGETNGKTWARFSLWTTDRVKGQSGEYEKKFSSWGGICNGPQAEWLIRDGKKGSLVAVTGAIRIDSHTDKEGKVHASGEFTRVADIRVLDAREQEDKPADSPAPRVAKAAPSGGGTGGGGLTAEDPPFQRMDWP